MSVTPLSTKPTTEAAWTHYAALAKQWRDDPERANSTAFCAQMARAYLAWQRLFLASEEAA